MTDWSPISAVIRPDEAARRPRFGLTVIFCLWKLVLLVVLLLASGPAYDTSSTFIVGEDEPSSISRLSSWDVAFFTSLARRGYRYEQEWAFGYGHTQLIGLATRQLSRFIGSTESTKTEAFVAVIISIFAHYGSVLVLFSLSKRLLSDNKLAFTSATLHILTPAGVFLCAPYAESLFSLLAFSSLNLNYDGRRAQTYLGQTRLIASGFFVGLSCTIRSNGLFYGLLFIPGLAMSRKLPESSFRCFALMSGGALAGLGAVIPQLIAYLQFCYGKAQYDQPEWCQQTVPSVYTYVQKKYWDVGFLSYWTKANIPLFFLSSPLLFVLLISGWGAMRRPGSEASTTNTDARALVQRLGLIQIVLAVLAISMYHIQIVMRIASGYPIWYWWLAQIMQHRDSTKSRRQDKVVLAIRAGVAYAVIQAGLFATFLPPA